MHHPNRDNITGYAKLLEDISQAYVSIQQETVSYLHRQLLQSQWEIGRYIIEFEQQGKKTAPYGQRLLTTLSQDLTLQHGRGFSLSNLKRIRQFYLTYPNGATLSHHLTWSHYVELLKIDDPIERSFYEQQAIRENWNVRELKRQKKTGLFLRLAASKDKVSILRLASEGQIISRPEDLVRDPYILDFLQIPEPYHLSESELERRLIEHLQQFLLELGKGFAFVGRQYRITLGNRHHYVDLVFYHRILKCFVLIDLKKDEAGYEDVGQMNMYLGYFETEENMPDDHPPIGIILAREKDDLLIKYAMHGITTQLFVSRYQMYLPNQEELRAEVQKIYLDAKKS